MYWRSTPPVGQLPAGGGWRNDGTPVRTFDLRHFGGWCIGILIGQINYSRQGGHPGHGQKQRKELARYNITANAIAPGAAHL